MNLASVIHSGDSRSWMWNIWANYYWRFWDQSIKTYFVSELEDSPKGTINIKAGKTPIREWARTLIEALNQIEEEYILYWHEDHLLIANVDGELLNALPNVMSTNNISLVKACGWHAGHDKAIGRMKKTEIKALEHYLYKYPEGVGYEVSHQPSIWKKSLLILSLQGIDTPWNHELQGSNHICGRGNIHAIIDRDPNIDLSLCEKKYAGTIELKELYMPRDLYPVPYVETLSKGRIIPAWEKLYKELE